ncbi:MAG: DUF3105 domain-containing protein [Nocardioides sp.]
MNGSRLAIAVGAAVLVVAGVVLVPLLLGNDDDGSGTLGSRAGGGDSLPAPSPADESTGLEQVKTFGLDEVVHTPDEVDYPQSPPVGGNHADEWLQCGTYDQPVREENMVHALEHGTVWITYDDSVSEGDVEELVAELPPKGVLSPYDDQRAPVVVTVWDTQLALTGADDPRLEGFIAQYGDGGTAPEPFASCEGGVQEFETLDS